MGDSLARKLLQHFKDQLECYGLEVHPFLVGWYNERLEPEHQTFKLSYPEDTLAFSVQSTPSMFEKLLIPFIKAMSDAEFNEIRNPLDSAIHQKLDEAKRECQLVDRDGIVLIHDHDVDEDGKPKVLVQCAGDVTGSVRMYDNRDLEKDQLFETPFGKVCACALHPRYGGWFVFRGVYVFKNLQHADLQRPPRLEILKSKEKIRDFLYQANNDGMKYRGGWRDIIEPAERYSDEQMEYEGATSREKRRTVLVRLRNMKAPGALEEQRSAPLLRYIGLGCALGLLFLVWRRPLR